MSEIERVHLESAFVLHQRAYKNTSQLIDCVTQRHGIVSLVAQGSRRPGRGQRAILQPFIPVRLSWTRRGELGRLTQVEAAHGATPLTGNALLAGYYINELILRLLAKGDPNPTAYACYSRCLATLTAQKDVARALRIFELGILHALGYGIELNHDVETGQPIQAELSYRFEVERGACVHTGPADGENTFLGSELIALREGELSDDRSLRAARRLLKPVLALYLGDRPLKSSLVMRDIASRGLGS